MVTLVGCLRRNWGMIKKKLKPWYPTKEKEIQAELAQFLDASFRIGTRIHNNSIYGNWVIVGTDVANVLNGIDNTVYTTTHTYVPGPSYSGVSYFCGTTYTTNYTTMPVVTGTTNFISFSG